MKNLLSALLLGTDNRVSGIIALTIVALIALGCTCGKGLDLSNLAANSNSSSSDTSSDDSNEGVPSRELIDALVAETTADFNYAVNLDDFSKMYEKASSDFKSTYTEEKFKETFKDFVAKKRQVGPILGKAVTMDPQLSTPPRIRKEQGLDILVVEGKYDTTPVPVTFEYEYVKRGGDWKLLKLIVKLI